MMKIFYRNTARRVICLLIAAFFLSSFPAGGATALALCLDAEKNHIIGQEHLHLADCHSSVNEGQPLFYEYSSTMADRESEGCVDISLSNSNVLSRSSKKILPDPAKVIFSFVLLDRQYGYHEKLAGQTSSVLSQPQIISSYINTLRTVVLLV